MSSKPHEEYRGKFGPTDEEMSELNKRFQRMALRLMEDAGDDPEKIKEYAKDIDRMLNTFRAGAQFDDQRMRLDNKTPTTIVSVNELADELKSLLGDE